MTAGRGRPAGRRPGRRFTDLVEDLAAWVLTAAGAFLVVAAVAGGTAAHGETVQRARAEHATRTATEAVLLADAPVLAGVRDSAPAVARVEVAWSAADGTSRTGLVQVPAGTPAGRTVTVWLDRDGDLTTPPLDEAGAVMVGGVVATGVLMLGGAVIGSCWGGVRFLTGRANARRWEREWARVEPEWSGNLR